MSIKIKVKTNPSPCKHSVVTITEDGVDTISVFHDTDFDNDDFILGIDGKYLYKVIRKQLEMSGKKLSESTDDIEGLIL